MLLLKEALAAGWNFLQRRQEPAATSLAEGSICLQCGCCALVDFSIRVMRTRLPMEDTFSYGWQSCALSGGPRVAGCSSMLRRGELSQLVNLCPQA